MRSEQTPQYSKEYPPSEKLFVMKFGGTSVGNAHAIEQTASIIQKSLKDTPCCLVVVVSAIRGVTDSLVTIGRNIEKNAREENDLIIEDLEYRHWNVVNNLELPSSIHVELFDGIEKLFVHLRKTISTTTPFNLESLDPLLSFGERFNARIVAAKLKAIGIQAEALDASSFIETDDHFGNAYPNFANTEIYAKRAIYPRLHSGIVPVVTGFIGATRDNRMTTLGRGGSDYTASILGRVLHAQEVWIWTDVDGLYSADPRTNPDATFLPVVSQEYAQELAQQGAKVLYRKTIEPLLGQDVILRIKNTFHPEFPGTTIIPSR
ncbi:MAG: aspartate kinase [bacterium]|nr:aspartate kinase [bacterium]